MKKIKMILAAFKEIHRLEKRLMPTSVITAFIVAIQPFVNIWFTGKIIDLLYMRAEKAELVLYIFLAVAINFLLFFLNNILNEYYSVLRKNLYREELKNVAQKLYSISLKQIENQNFQELIHKHAEAQSRVKSAFSQFGWMIKDFISGLITLCISTIIIAPLLKIGFYTTGSTYFERPIFLITIFVAILVMVIIILIIALKMNKAWFNASDEYSKLDRLFYYFLNIFTDYKTGKDIRLYKEQELIKCIATDKILNDGEKVLRKASLNTAKSSSFIAVLGAIVGFGVYLFIGVKGIFGLFGIGSLILYCGSFMQIINGIIKMAATFGKTEEMVPLVNYYFEIMNVKNDMEYGNEILDLKNKIEIEFKDVFFKYPNTEKYILKNINIKISNGDNLAVVGKNGSGKTTFIKLICRFYDVSDGEILINGINIKEYTQKSLIELYSIVFQDFKIFSTTLAHNVSVGQSYNNKELFDILDKANLKERVMQMEEKENTYLFKDLEQSGVEISGGEAQKLALSRALYKDAPVVILDEPTASLDPIAESEIYARFNSFVEDKTAIYISHRLSSCYFCNKIAVFDSGELVEVGTHEQLIKQKGKYFELWNAQAKYYVGD